MFLYNDVCSCACITLTVARRINIEPVKDISKMPTHYEFEIPLLLFYYMPLLPEILRKQIYDT